MFAPDTQKLSLNEQSDLFFMDYSLMPLFVQENYVSVTPIDARYVQHSQQLWRRQFDCKTGRVGGR